MEKMLQKEMIFNEAKSPYLNNGKCAFERNKYKYSGVYFILDGDIVKYVGMSLVNCYNACYRHFQAWNDRKNPTSRAVYSKEGYRIFMQIMSSADAAILEAAYINSLNPSDNREYYKHHKRFDSRKVAGKTYDDVPF